MKTVCTPDALNTDGRCIYLKKYRRRLWILMYDLERIRARKHEEDLARWTAPIWAANLDARPRQFDKDCLVLRDLGLMHPQEIRLVFEQPDREMDLAEFFRERRNGHVPYPSQTPEASRLRQEAHREKKKAESVEEIVTTPVTSFEGDVTSDVTSLAGARDPESGSGIRNPDPVPVILKNRIPDPVPVPVTTVERLQEVGMTRQKAENRVKEFGEERCKELLEALPYASPPATNPAAWIFDRLKHNYELPPGYLKAKEAELVARQQQAQQSMPMLGSVQGGKTPGNGQPATGNSDGTVARSPLPVAASKTPQPTIKEALGFHGEAFANPPDFRAAKEKLEQLKPLEEGGQMHGSG